MSDKKLQIVALGGLGEFGMNMMCIRYGDDIIVVDSGMMFPEDELLGVDIVTPDLTYLKENREYVRALLLTHGHEDHIGAVAFFLDEFDVPVYGTPFTLSLVERRLADYGKRGVLLLLSDSTNADRPGYSDSERAVRPRLEDVFHRAEQKLFVSCFS